MGQTLSSCFGYEPEKKPKKKPKKKKTVRFEEVGTIEMAEVPNVSQNETYQFNDQNDQWSLIVNVSDSESTK